MSQIELNNQVINMLYELINGNPSILRNTLKEHYETIYIKADELKNDNYIVINGELISHPQKWMRRVR